MTGKVPFQDEHPQSGIIGDARIVKAMINDERPKRPSKSVVDSGLWNLWSRCWLKEPDSRPSMTRVLEELRNLAVGYRRLRILSIGMHMLSNRTKLCQLKTYR